MAGAGAFLWLLAGRDEWPYSSVLVLRSRGIGHKGSKSNGLKLLGFRVKATALYIVG